MYDLLRNRAASFRQDVRGNVAVVFGLSLLPFSYLVAAGVDLSRLNDRRAAVQNAVDNAVMAAVIEAAGGTPSDAAVRTAISGAIARYTDITLTQGTSSTVNGTTTVTGSGNTSCTYTTTVTPQTSTCANTTLAYNTPSPATYPATVKGTIGLPM
jgi:Flp pilus assembly protein TadG